eukprot:6182293-Pleurochrysis_carterae.AAC.1
MRRFASGLRAHTAERERAARWQFMDGYEAFIKANQHILDEYASIDEEDERSEQCVRAAPPPAQHTHRSDH